MPRCEIVLPFVFRQASTSPRPNGIAPDALKAGVIVAIVCDILVGHRELSNSEQNDPPLLCAMPAFGTLVHIIPLPRPCVRAPDD